MSVIFDYKVVFESRYANNLVNRSIKTAGFENVPKWMFLFVLLLKDFTDNEIFTATDLLVNSRLASSY